MHDVQSRQVKTGADPRQRPDFIALRDEISKLNHPARPDVNWALVEKLSLTLFEHNGVELQTAAWYTLARTHIAAVDGMNEGLAVIHAMIAHQWALLWPQPTHSRVEIISGLSQRLQKVFRTLTLSHHDLPALYQCEKRLTALIDVLTRHELKQASQLDGLSRQVQQAMTRFENSPVEEEHAPPTMLPPQTLSTERTLSESRLVYVIRPEPEVSVEVVHEIPPVPPKWPQFVGGMLTAFTLSAIGLWGWNVLHRTDESAQILSASVSALPAPLTTEQLSRLQHTDKPLNASKWLTQASEQLDAVAKLSPGWSLQYGNQILNQARILWPNESEVQQMQQRWQQQMAMNTLPENALNGWHQGMVQLQSLADQLNALDGQKGKYITVSELKSSVFAMMTSFRKTVPLEEQLRVLRAHTLEEGQKPLQILQAEQHLKVLIQTLEQEK